jgi:serine/threonine protein kinase
MAYILLCGFPPFYDDNERKTLQLVQKAKLHFPSPAWDDVSDEAKQFVKHLLCRDPKKRPTASKALNDPWLNQEQMQPMGVSERSTFACPEQKSAGVKPLKMRHQERTVFQMFLTMIKVKKAVKTTSRMM